MTIEQPIASERFLSAETMRVEPHPSEIPAIQALTLLAKRKVAVFAGAVAVAGVALISMAVLPPAYKADALILTPQQQQSSASVFAGGALAGLAGGSSMAAQLGLKNPADLYVGILKSRTIADDIVKQFKLKQVYHKELDSDARKVLDKRAAFTSGKDSLIVISVTDKDPVRAAQMANAYIDELYRQNSRLALTEASQRRMFFEQQIAQEKEALAQAEADLKMAEHKTGLVVPAGQAEVLIRSSAEIRAAIASREVELQAMRSYATEENPRVQVLQREIAGLQAQLASLEGSGKNSLEMSAGQLPEATLEYSRKLRDVKYHETLFELLSKQYEASRIDEAKQAPLIQVVDRAVAPDKSTRPSWPILIVGWLAAGFVLSALSILALYWLQELKDRWGNLQAAIA